MSIGIVGLPNVGKSTLFNALLKRQVANVANYPFCTIEPNIGVIEVPDERLPVLAKIVGTEKIIPAVVEFYDIAGLVKGASEGEGLGNKFLSHIREVAAIIHVVRLFEDNNIVHVSNYIDPVEDIKTITTELVLADLSTVTKQPDPRMNATKEERNTYQIIQEVKKGLDKGIPVRLMSLSPEEIQAISSLNLITAKPVLYVFNLSESQLEDFQNTNNKIKEVLSKLGEPPDFIALCARLENEILSLSENEQKEFLKHYRLDDIGLNRLIKQAYKLLGLISMLTAGVKEVRAWTIPSGIPAQEASGVIHTDFIKHFIKADLISYQKFVEYGGWAKAREQGQVQTVGKEYIIQEGEVVEFKIGV
ncbi:redox-regulated ATPase YchF [Candidatus Gottesmanbacteria bacterium RIFCSPLOWO2_01_FULL_39_12b]|uniref:Ribosome-binding ATPase YchF n=1 Tax=Candidatus Gottesmanbacteria bacterium RIFCSPLOWO2_01_FULL_39_12b TaxID=1798388 RepID=A0A1F6AR07_9BACT|nr:MAG: redox-regulated ATPase YchF [Candidatus Gottesmanbacteria bacterium RIFCSPLOWO2_01_FULL_39_12b]